MYQKTVLSNGLRVITGAMPHTHSVCIALFIGVGSRYEEDKEAGASHFIEHLCFRGTAQRPDPREISEAIEGVGGVLNGATDKELTFYWCKVARPHFVSAAAVLVDMLLNSRFVPEDIEKERQVIVEEIHQSKDLPSQQVGMLIDEALYAGHPLGRDIAGTQDSVAGLTRASLLGYMHHHYNPRNTVVTVAGAVQHAEVVELMERLLGAWANPGDHLSCRPFPEKAGQQVRIEKRQTEQAHLCLALPGLSIFHPLRFPLDLLNVLLGEGMSSRLFSQIRDKLGLAYSICSYVEHFQDTGSLTVSASVDPANLPRALEAILEQLALLKNGIPPAELQKAREISKGRLLLRMEDSRNVAGWLGGQEILTGRIQTLDEMVRIIDAINLEQIQELSQLLLKGGSLRLAVVGPLEDPTPLQSLLKL